MQSCNAICNAIVQGEYVIQLCSAIVKCTYDPERKLCSNPVLCILSLELLVVRRACDRLEPDIEYVLMRRRKVLSSLLDLDY